MGLYIRCERQSLCATVSREALHELRSNLNRYRDMVADNYLQLNTCNLFDILDAKCDPECRYLGDHRCGALALLCLEECIFMLTVDDLRDCSSDENMAMIQILEAFIGYVTSPPYQATCKTNSASEYLSIYKLRFMGKGMQYLEKMSQKRNESFGSNC